MSTSNSLPSDRLSFSVPELAKAVGVSHVAIYNAINRGELKSFQLGRRRLISWEAALEFIRAREGASLTPHEQHQLATA